MFSRFVAAALALLLCASGCAHRTGGARTGMLAPGAGARTQPAAAHRDPEVWRRYVRGLALGTRVRMELDDGHRLTGTLMGVEDNAIVVQPRRRLPEPERVIALDRLVWLEPDTGGVGVGRAVAIGVLSGAGTFFGLLLMSFALLSD